MAQPCSDDEREDPWTLTQYDHVDEFFLTQQQENKFLNDNKVDFELRRYRLRRRFVRELRKLLNEEDWVETWPRSLRRDRKGTWINAIIHRQVTHMYVHA